MKITEKSENKLLGRTLVSAVVEHHKKPTPSEAEIKKQIAIQTKSKEELIQVKKIQTKFSSGISEIQAYVYENEQAIKNTQINKKKNGKQEASKEQSPK